MSGNPLLDLLPAIGEPGLRLRYGLVSATSPITVTLASSTTAVVCRKLASYTPTNGHFVAVLVAQGATPLVLGQVNS